MSESTAAPAPSPAPGPSEGVSSPAPITQTPISISDAARLLNQQRRPAQNTSEQSGNPVDATRKPSPNEARAAAAAAPVAPPAPTASVAPPLPAGLAAMEAALGLPGAITPAPPELHTVTARPAATHGRHGRDRRAALHAGRAARDDRQSHRLHQENPGHRHARSAIAGAGAGAAWWCCRISSPSSKNCIRRSTSRCNGRIWRCWRPTRGSISTPRRPTSGRWPSNSASAT